MLSGCKYYVVPGACFVKLMIEQFPSFPQRTWIYPSASLLSEYNIQYSSWSHFIRNLTGIIFQFWHTRSAVLLILNIDVLYISQSASQNICKKNAPKSGLIGLIDWIHWTSDPVIHPPELTCISMRCIQVFEASLRLTPRKGHMKRPYNVHHSCKRLPQHCQTALPSPAGCLINPTWSSFGQQPTECSLAPSFHKHTSRSLKYVTKSC